LWWCDSTHGFGQDRTNDTDNPISHGLSKRLFQSPGPLKEIASIAEVSPLKLKEEVDLEWSEEPQEWAD
jgi:hypothetical protein